MNKDLPIKFHAVLPMRGGSERVIGKNLRPLRQIPLFEWMLTSLIDAKLGSEHAFATIIVDTDDDLIEKKCVQAIERANATSRAIVVRRDEAVIGGSVSMCLVLQARAKYCLEHKMWSREDVVVQVHSTSPFFSHTSISKCLDQYQRSNGRFDSAMGVTKLHTRFWNHKGEPMNHDPDLLLRTQDLDPIYEDNSAIYVTPMALLLSDNPQRVGKHPMLFEVDPLEATDIDTETDFMLAESLAKTIFKSRMAAAPHTVLVTGAFGGIGRACVQTFLDQGWQVLGVDKSPISPPVPGSEQLTENKNFHFFHCDIADPVQLQSLYRDVEAKINLSTTGINAIVNNAAIQIIKPLDQCTATEFDQIMAVNTRAPFLLTTTFLPMLIRARHASVVNISSVHALATSPSIGLYAASKGALLAITRSMAIEFAVHGIRVNAVLPGAVDTGMLRAGLLRENGQTSSSSSDKSSPVNAVPFGSVIEEKLASLSAKTVIGRVGIPSEISNVIFFLSSTLSSYVTGQSIVVDGGATARLSTE